MSDVRIHRLACCLAGLLLLVVLSLFPGGVQGQDEETPPPSSQVSNSGQTQPPGLAQALIPEGEFAIQLAEALKLTPATDQVQGEERLSSAGIEPANGWISDYPVTPEVLGDIEKDVAAAAEQTRIELKKDEALKVLSDVKAHLGLDVSLQAARPAGSSNQPGNTTIYGYTDQHGVLHYTDRLESIPEEFRQQAKILRQAVPKPSGASSTADVSVPPGPQYAVSPEIVSGYYTDPGPPIITYYPPPDPYYYLYSWVPYPFWSTGFYFPGFFLLNNFHRHVFFHDHGVIVSHHGGSGSFQGTSGRLFTNTTAGLTSPRSFDSPGFQSGARAILAIRQNRINTTSAGVPFRSTPSAPAFGQTRLAGPVGQMPAFQNRSGATFRRNFPAAATFGVRPFVQPTFPHRQFVMPPQINFSPAPAFHRFGGTQNFGNSPMGAFHGGGGGAFGGFHGGGGFGRH